MLIINADDWGRTTAETDVALACQQLGRVTSVSAMVFMDDSVRAAELALEYGVDVGLHLNLSQRYTRPPVSSVAETQDRVVRFMTRSKYALLLYQPTLRRSFSEVYLAQAEEFMRLYGQPPSHVDGHQHRHLCANMLIDPIIPRGVKVRRNFSFWPGEKSSLNRIYRNLVDRWLARRYGLTDFFFSLGQCLKGNRLTRVAELAKSANVELMTHPIHSEEYDYLVSTKYSELLSGLDKGSYAHL